MDLEHSGKPDGTHQVVPFRPRTGKTRRPDKLVFRSGERGSPVRDFAKYHQPHGRDDYGHRMKMNAIVLVLTSTMVMAGVWMVTMITHPHS